jgi:hypothetical protein
MHVNAAPGIIRPLIRRPLPEQSRSPYQNGVLTQAGFGDVADALLDELVPLGTFVMKALKDA